MCGEVPDSKVAEDQAIVWLVRLRAEAVAPQQRREFRAWLAYPENQSAFADVLRLWERLGCVRRLLQAG